MTTTTHQILGIMSGSSLDGLDLAICDLTTTTDAEGVLSVVDWSIRAATTDPYPPLWRARLKSAPHLPGEELWRLHADLGKWIGRRAADFLQQHPELNPTLIGSHGHTIFHDPERGFTTQIGNGAFIATVTGLTTVTEFRSSDVAAGGQGAPLAPVADKYLFPEHGAFLNLGGIANLSVRQTDGRYLAGDITGCCQILDRLANLAGLPYDAGGRLAASGQFNADLADRIGGLPFHRGPYPKSLGNGWVRDTLWPLLATSDLPVADRLSTFTKWLAVKIGTDVLSVLPNSEIKKDPASVTECLVTGGGARNAYLLQQLNRIGKEDGVCFTVPPPTVADFKEAALMALTALLRVAGQPNSLATATGARFPTINGAVYLPPPKH
ncbi:anhydro-N-acetylmuramic acid kinase [Lewinella sp. 4G2]|uniref:anhydro-N-acetylmuramic acid kinase n=1 Tax=Lewinella sp. 4G2 TaxID=1803372 RepID=UPI0007B4C9FD|nr:anhydro-N-acetylmuramic acid kinase [Lewinella sp. 4G2]OAV43947.1 hypothetical protein A3850_005320 [Lewinella sp. 4G2]